MADSLSFMSGASYSPTGQALNATATQELSGLGVTGNSYNGYVPPNTTAAIPSSNLTSPTLNLPSGSQPDNGSNLVAGVIAGQNASLTPTSDTSALDAATKGYNDASKTYTDLTANAPDESQMLSTIENQNGLPGQKSQIDQLKTELAGLSASYNNQYQNIGAKGVEAGTPQVFISGEQASQQRQASVVLAGKSAVLAALQGNYNEAESLARQTADLQFKAAEDKITNAYNFLKLNADTLTTAQATQIKTSAAQQKTDLVAQKANVTTALSSGVQTAFWTKPNGTVVRTNDGKEYSTPQEAFADGVLPDFSNAPKINPVGKSETKTLNGHSYHIVYDQAGNVLSKTDLGVVGKGTGTVPTNSVPGLSAKQLTRVKQIIAANPGEYGHAADQMDSELGAGTATKADTLLKSTYLIPTDASNILNLSGPPPTVEAWQAGRTKFINDHSYNPTAAATAYDKFVKKPTKSTSTAITNPFK